MIDKARPLERPLSHLGLPLRPRILDPHSTVAVSTPFGRPAVQSKVPSSVSALKILRCRFKVHSFECAGVEDQINFSWKVWEKKKLCYDGHCAVVPIDNVFFCLFWTKTDEKGILLSSFLSLLHFLSLHLQECSCLKCLANSWDGGSANRIVIPRWRQLQIALRRQKITKHAWLQTEPAPLVCSQRGKEPKHCRACFASKDERRRSPGLCPGQEKLRPRPSPWNLDPSCSAPPRPRKRKDVQRRRRD